MFLALILSDYEIWLAFTLFKTNYDSASILAFSYILDWTDLSLGGELEVIEGSEVAFGLYYLICFFA